MNLNLNETKNEPQMLILESTIMEEIVETILKNYVQIPHCPTLPPPPPSCSMLDILLHSHQN